MVALFRVNFILLIILCICVSEHCLAHGDISKRIKQISTSITLHPDSLLLYYQRGVLYTQHGDYELALNDFKVCEQLNYTNTFLQLDIAKVLFYLKNYHKAMPLVEEIICNEPTNIFALQLKAEILKAQKMYTEAAFYFEDALFNNSSPIPEKYIIISEMWQLSKHLDANCNALKILEEGIKKLGPLFVLKKEIINFHLKNGDLADAIKIQEEIVKSLNRKEHSYYDLALMKIDLGRNESAQNDLNLALKAVEQLPQKAKNTRAIGELTQKIKQLLFQ